MTHFVKELSEMPIDRLSEVASPLQNTQLLPG